MLILNGGEGVVGYLGGQWGGDDGKGGRGGINKCNVA